VSLPNPTTLWEEYERESAELLEQVLAGDLVENWAALEPGTGAMMQHTRPRFKKCRDHLYRATRLCHGRFDAPDIRLFVSQGLFDH
jgi:hypothetical protein